MVTCHIFSDASIPTLLIAINQVKKGMNAQPMVIAMVTWFAMET